MKKVISLLLVLALLLPCVSVFASAEGPDSNHVSAISPRYKILAACRADLDSDGGGMYTFSGSARANSKVKISITVTLQRANSSASSGWDPYATVTDSDTYAASCSGQRYLSSGTYRTQTTVYVYDTSGNFIESTTIYSSEITV